MTNTVTEIGDEHSTAVLGDGAAVWLRPMHATDANRLVRFHARLSAETTRLRFFTFHPELSPREIDRFTHVDHRDREALVAIIDNEIIGVARWDRLADPSHAEVAFVVADEWQGRGVGRLLLAALTDRARAAGVETFDAQVLPHNARMLALFRSSGSSMKHDFVDGVVNVELVIASTSAGHDGRAGTDCGTA